MDKITSSRFARKNGRSDESAQKFVFQHEEIPWLTLITCKGFDEVTGRVINIIPVVKAVLVEYRTRNKISDFHISI